VPERYLGQTLGKYRIESLLGSGGFAWVFKGYDPELDIPVAIKVLKPQFAGDQAVVDRFKREASTAARLRHPNIIKIYAVGRENDAVYFVMDYLPSGLANRLESTQSLPEDYVLRVGVDVARALGFAHREGVIHRDIKVDNILFDSHGNAVVADFGIARALSGYTNQTGTNMVVGTPQYFAPEQARAKPLDGRADLYSLGVTMFRAATGQLPFEGEDWYEIARQRGGAPCAAVRDPALSAEFEASSCSAWPSRLTTDRRRANCCATRCGTSCRCAGIRRRPAVTVPTTPASSGTQISNGPVAQPARRRLWSGAALATIIMAAIVALIALPLGGRSGRRMPPRIPCSGHEHHGRDRHRCCGGSADSTGIVAAEGDDSREGNAARFGWAFQVRFDRRQRTGGCAGHDWGRGCWNRELPSRQSATRSVRRACGFPHN
jgi:hypothetical protein